MLLWLGSLFEAQMSYVFPTSFFFLSLSPWLSAFVTGHLTYLLVGTYLHS